LVADILHMCLMSYKSLVTEIGESHYAAYRSQPLSSRRFIGRIEYLDKLQNYFTHQIGELPHLKIFVLYGMGGVGKTQICLKFAEQGL
jgi:flagellar biosynthesis GTPase FlhF